MAVNRETTNGWKCRFAGGRVGYDLALRAALAKYELDAQPNDQVIYPNTRVDDHNQPRMLAVFEVKKEIPGKWGNYKIWHTKLSTHTPTVT